MKKNIFKYRWVWMWSYLGLLTYELCLKNPWVVFGGAVASNPPWDTSSAPASAFLHISSFSLLGFLAMFASQDKPERTQIRYSLWFLSYSGLTELIQSFVPNRWPSGEDVIFNVLGLIVGVIMFRKVSQYYQKNFGQIPMFLENPIEA